MRHHLHSKTVLPRQSASSPPGGASTTDVCNDSLLCAKESAEEARLSLPAFWRGVADGRLPAPVYPAPRAPRWYRSELREAIRATRARPAEAKAARRAAKHARDAAPETIRNPAR